MENVKNEVREEVETKEFTVAEVKELTTKDGSRKFNVYKVRGKSGLMDMKFRADFKGTKPTEKCVIVVPKEKASVDKRGYYPVLWIGEVLEIKPLPPMKSNVDEYFD